MISVGRISAPKASDVLAEELRGRIRSGDIPEGLALPTERVLSAQTGLSRMSVRDALRILEQDGLIEIRPGRGGGARVRRPAGDELTRQLELFIWGRKIGVEHLHDVRTALEGLAAEGAAHARTDADVADLVAKTEAVEAAVDEINRYLEANLAWHMAVVRASHNELLISFMNVLSNAIHEATASDAFDSDDLRESTLKIHRRILAAIVAGDAAAARRRMTRHVSAAREVALIGEGARHGRVPPTIRQGWTEAPIRPHRTTGPRAKSIVAAGMVPGKKIGTSRKPATQAPSEATKGSTAAANSTTGKKGVRPEGR